MFLLKGPCTVLLTDGHTLSVRAGAAAQKNARDILGGTELSGFKARTEGTAFS